MFSKAQMRFAVLAVNNRFETTQSQNKRFGAGLWRWSETLVTSSVLHLIQKIFYDRKFENFFRSGHPFFQSSIKRKFGGYFSQFYLLVVLFMSNYLGLSYPLKTSRKLHSSFPIWDKKALLFQFLSPRKVDKISYFFQPYNVCKPIWKADS